MIAGVTLPIHSSHTITEMHVHIVHSSTYTHKEVVRFLTYITREWLREMREEESRFRTLCMLIVEKIFLGVEAISGINISIIWLKRTYGESDG